MEKKQHKQIISLFILIIDNELTPPITKTEEKFTPHIKQKLLPFILNITHHIKQK